MVDDRAYQRIGCGLGLHGKKGPCQQHNGPIPLNLFPGCESNRDSTRENECMNQVALAIVGLAIGFCVVMLVSYSSGALGPMAHHQYLHP
jgi:hypothetical protein